ncbi:MAG: OmpH family outer membrane protein [Pseudomonadota bacterium]
MRFTWTTTTLVAATLAAGLLTAPLAHAQQSLKIGVVSVQRLLQESPQTKATLESLEQEFAPRANTIRAKEQSFIEKSERVQRDLQVMSEAERRNAEKDLREDKREIDRLKSEFVEDQNLRRNELLGALQKSLGEQINEFGKAGSYDLIIGEGVLFASGVVDVTDEILAQMNASVGDGKDAR